MVFISGPRQAGKTTFTKSIAKDYNNSLYFNWDIIDEKQKLINEPLFYENINRRDSSLPLIVFDELHKYKDWKNYLKSVYDRDKGNYTFVVSGSGRLDLYQKGGDSLAGRYLMLYMWPFTLAELAKNNLSFKEFKSNPIGLHDPSTGTYDIWNKLGKLSGFPDPFLSDDIQFYNIWSRTYRKQLLREDIRDLAAIRNIENVELLFSLLPSKIGSPISMASLARDINVSFDSIRNWLDIFENFFLIFRLSPWSRKISRSISKEKKLYLFDYAVIESASERFENMVALEFLRALSNWNDTGLGNFSLHYVRNRDKEEVDFLIADNNHPFVLIEAKMSDSTPSKSLRKFQDIFQIPAIQLINQPGICKLISNNDMKIMVISADHWLSLLP
jgi:predicted AAA+ superfamily ATPase